jgi:hypothetical protein
MAYGEETCIQSKENPNGQQTIKAIEKVLS